MNSDEFLAHIKTLDVSGDHTLTETLRTTSSATVVFSGLPSVDLKTAVNPEFELGQTLGEGGMGLVRSAKQLALHREVAVKTLRPERTNPQARAGLLHEALVTGGLEHPNVVPIYTLGQTRTGDPVIVMKRIDGVPWNACIDDPSVAPELDLNDVLGWHLDIFTQLCRAIQFAHSRGILHRDIKPENVMVGAYGEVYLVDWGIATTYDPDKDFLTFVGDHDGICGTPAYMAPEQTTGLGADQGVHTDVFLLGATLYHVLAGEPPFLGKSLFETMFKAHEAAIEPIDGASDELFAVVARAMAKDPKDRFESVDALRRAVIEAESHRASNALTDEALDRLEQLRELVAKADAGDDGAVRGLAGECRFGFEQALRAWSDNPTARSGRDDSLRALVRWELGQENIGPARSIAAAMQVSDPELADEIAQVVREIEVRKADVEQLRERQQDFDLGTGANERVRLAAFTVLFWVFVPLLSGLFVRQGWSDVTHLSYFLHGVLVSALIAGAIFYKRETLLRNEANRRMAVYCIAFALWVPVFRIVMILNGQQVEQALTFEVATYGLVVGGVGALSEQGSVYPILLYAAAAVGASLVPGYVYEFIALANIFGVGWLAVVWLRQSRVD